MKEIERQAAEQSRQVDANSTRLLDKIAEKKTRVDLEVKKLHQTIQTVAQWNCLSERQIYENLTQLKK